MFSLYLFSRPNIYCLNTIHIHTIADVAISPKLRPHHVFLFINLPMGNNNDVT